MIPVVLIGAAIALTIADKLFGKNSKPSAPSDTTLDSILHAYDNRPVVDGGKLTGHFLDRRPLKDGGVHVHKGIDIAAKLGNNVRAISDGTVFLLWPNGEVRGYGNTVVIKHDDGKASLYGHLLSWVSNVPVGTRVTRGQIIGYVGNTESGSIGPHMKPHLHLELHTRATKSINPNNPARLDPEQYLASIGMKVG